MRPRLAPHFEPPLRALAPSLRLLLLLVSTALAAAPSVRAAQSWAPEARVLDVSYQGALDLTRDVRHGAAYLQLVPPVTLGGVPHDAVLVGEGFLHFLVSADGRVPQPPSDDPGAAPAAAMGPRVDLLPTDGLQLGPQARVLVRLEGEKLHVRWAGLQRRGARSQAIVEALVAPDDVRIQYLHVPPGFVAQDDTKSLPRSATTFRLIDTGGELLLGPSAPIHAMSSEPPPAGCDPAVGTWCEYADSGVNDDCSGGSTPCSTRVEDRWSFTEGDWCKNCPYVFYVLVECGREMHFPMDDMEALDMTVTNIVTGQRPSLRCVNQTYLGTVVTGPDTFSRTCGVPPSSDEYWSPPLNVANNAGLGHVIVSDASPSDGDCTTQGEPACSELPPDGGVAATVVYGEDQVIDCFVQDNTGLCGIYRIEMISGGNVWQLFSNCDGTNTPQFNIYFDCTEAWADYDPLPELGIGNATATGDCWTYDITFEVENIGCVDELGDVPVRISSTCGDVLDVVVPGPVPAHGIIPFTQRMTLSCPQATLSLELDPDDDVLECTESGTASSCDAEIGDDEITVSTTCCPIMDAGAGKVACAGDPVPLADASSQFGDTFAWSDGGAGGSFSPSAAVRNPTYQPPAGVLGPITLTLDVSFSGSGCTRTDTVTVDVRPRPVTDAGTAKTACGAEPVPLSDASAPSATGFTWSDGGAGGIFEPSPFVLHPTYRNATPGAHVLTLHAEIVATGCDATDTVTVTVHADPAVAAGPDEETCEDAAALLDEAVAGGAHDLTWSDGGAGGTFVPSARVLHPSYEAPGPGSYTLTLTGTETHVDEPVSGTPLLLDRMDGAIGPHWSPAIAEVAPSGRRFLGRFSGNDAVTLELTGLPAHDELSLCFDLLVLQSWDGHGTTGPPTVGPDLFEVRVDGGPVLLRSSFAHAAPRVQSYPGPYVDDSSQGHPARTGASAIDTLGYDNGGDAVHPMTFTFAHSGPTLRLVFQGLNLEGLANESWGLDDVYVGLEPCASCTSSDSLELVVHELPGAEAGADTGACVGEDVPLDDAAPGTADVFAWSDGGMGGTFEPSASDLNPTYVQPALGTYTLTLTATTTATGCVSTDTVQVVIGDRPVVDAGPALSTCVLQAVAIPGSDGGAADTFLWSDGGAGGSFLPNDRALHPTYSNSRAGIYTLTLTGSEGAGGCSSSDTVTVQVNASPLVDAGTDKTGCAEGSIPLDDAFAGSGTTVQWSDGGTGGTFTPSATVLEPSYSHPAPGTYTLTLTATRPSTGCTSSDTVQVVVRANPAVNAGADKSACAGALTPLADSSSTGTTLQWSDGGAGGTFTPNATSLHPSYRNDAAGTYVLRLTATTNGCTREDTLTLVVSANPAVSAGADKDACAGAPVALSDATSSANTFAWSDGGAGGTFSPSANVRNPTYQHPTPGVRTLTLTATDSATGCTSQDTVLVTVRQLPVAAFAPIGGPWCEDVPVCFDNTTTGGTGWSWSFGAGGNSSQFEPCFTYSDPGTYTVQLTASNVCGSDSETLQITIQPKPVADFSYTSQGGSFCKDRPVTFTDLSTGSPTSWEWDFGDGQGSTAQNPVHTYTTDGLFIVSLRACNGCGCGPPRFRAIEIAASCQTNCEANSNQIGCQSGSAVQTGDTCVSHGNFNTTSYPCAPGLVYSGDNMTYDLNFASGSNFIVRLIETVPEPNGYDLDVMISDACNPPNCVAWGDSEVRYDDRTPANDDFFLIVDGRNGTCGPYRLEVECLAPGSTGSCTAPTFAGITSAEDQNACAIPGILVTWPAVTSWGNGPSGAACATGTFEIWRAPAGNLTDETRVGTAPSTATQFLDTRAVPREPYSYRVHAINDCCAQPAITTGRDTATDDFGNTIEVDAGTGGTITCNSPEVQLLGSASGGTGAGFSYAWTPADGLSDPTISNPTATLGAAYTLTVTDLGDGCSMTDVVVVTGDDVLPTADAGPDRELTCDQGTATLQGAALGGNASGGYSYAWSPAGLVSNPAAAVTTTTTPGTYTLTVTALATGCSDTDVVVVTASAQAPVANAGPNAELTCADDQVVLAGSAGGGDGSDGYLYSWTPAAGLIDPTSATPTATAPGTYVLLVTDAHTGCTDTDSVVVQLNVEPPVADAGPDASLGCDGAAVTLDGSALGGDGSEGYAFAWSPGEAVSDPSAADPTTSVAGTYVLTVTDVRTGCEATDTVVVAPGPGPSANAGPDRSITCDSGTASLQGSATGGDGSQGYTYSWSPAGLVSDPSSPTPTTSTPGSYVLTVTSVADGCTGSDAVLVRDLTIPPTVDGGPAPVITCAEGTVTLTGSATGGDGSGGRTYAWSPAGLVGDPSAPTTTTSTAGTYTLTVTDTATGCSASDTVTVGTDLAPPVAEAGPNRRLTCATTSVSLQGSASGGNASEGYAFSWSPSAGLSDPSAADPVATLPGTYTLTVTSLANGCIATDTMTVAQDIAAPTADAGPDRTLACGGAGPALNGSATGGDGSAGYTFRWEPAGAVSNPDAATTTATAAGTFTLTVTANATGCTDTDTVVVTSTGAPTAEAGPAGSITCTDGAADLAGSISGGNGSQGFTVQWTPAAGVASPTSLVTSTTIPGTYTLLVTDVATGCRSADHVVIADATGAPVANAGPASRITCAAPSATLSGSASGGTGTGGYAFEWQPAAQVANPSAATTTTTVPGTYLLTVIDLASGCTSTDSVVVEDGRLPPTASAGGDQVRDCEHPVATLAGTAGGGDGEDGYAYAWTPAGPLSNPASATPTTSTAGTYTLTVTDLATGCTDTDTVVVTDDFAAPVASAGADAVLDCDTPLVPLAGSGSGGNGTRGYSYAWSPAGDVSNPVSATPLALQPGTYTLTVTDRANGCTATDTVVVADGTTPPAVDAGPSQLLDCDTAIVTLSGSATGGGTYAYAWEPAGNVATPDAATTETALPGTYSLTVTDLGTGCVATDTVVVSQDRRVPRALAGPDRELDCANPVATLLGNATGGNATAGYAFRWEPAAGVSNPDVAQPTTSVPGTYTLTVTALATGCTDTDMVVVLQDSATPTAQAGPDRSITCAASVATLQGAGFGGDSSQGYAFSWEPAAQVASPSSATTTTSVPGVYVLTVTSVANGCSSTDTVLVEDRRTPPAVSAGADQLLDCDSVRVTLQGGATGGDGSAGYSYSWTPAGAVSNPTIAQPTTALAGTYVLTVTDVATGCVASDTVVIGRDERRPEASAGPDRRLDCTTSVVTLQGSATGGNGTLGYAYAWTPVTGLSDPASPTPQTSQSGLYTLTVTALATGCTDTDSVLVVRDDDPPTASAGDDATLSCGEPAITLQGSASGGNGSGGYAYSWSPSAGLSDAAIAEPVASLPGTYVLTVTDLVSGCTATDAVTLAQDVAVPAADAGPDAVIDCTAGSVGLSGSASGGNGSAGYGYAWSPAGGVSDATAPAPQALAAGTFVLTVTDLANGCTATDTVVVTASTTPPVADAGPAGQITCAQATAALTGSASGGDGSAGYSASWSPAGGVADPSALVTTTTEPGTYTLLVEDLATGCRAVDTVVVADSRTPPVAGAGPDRVLTCASGSVTLAGSASGGTGTLTYAWEPAADVSNPAAAQPTTSRAGTYTLTVTDAGTGCSASDVVLVTSDLAAPSASAGPDVSLGCQPSVALQGSGSAPSGDVSFSWSPAAGLSDPSSPAPLASAPGTYVLTVTSLDNGCTATDSVVVGTDAALPTASAGPDLRLSCGAPSVALLGSASGGSGTLGYAYSWEPSDSVSNPSIAQPTTSTPGTYTLTVIDVANGCTDSDEVVVLSDIDAPVADAGADAVLDCGAAGVTLQGSASGGNGSLGYGFHWEPAAAVTSPDSAATDATAAGTFTLTVTDLINGCTATDTVVVTLSEEPPTASAGPDATIRCDRPAAPLQGSASGGDGRLGYTASWSPTAGVANPAAFSTNTTIPGTYTLTVTDTFTGCRAFDTVVVGSDQQVPTAEAGAGAVLTCASPAAPLSGEASGGNGSLGYTFAWTPVTGVANPFSQNTTTTLAGTYTLTVTDRANGCTATDTVVITADQAPVTANAGPNKTVNCNVVQVTLDGAFTGGNGADGFAISWTPAAPLSDPASLTPVTSTGGTYTLTVTDLRTGCSDTDTVSVTVNRTPPAATAGPNRTMTCTQPTVTLNGGPGGANLVYSWSPPGLVSDPAARAPTTSTPGIYTLSVTNTATGCLGVDTVEVTDGRDFPVATAGPDITLTCGAPTATLQGSATGTGPFSYLWIPQAAVSDPSSPTPTTSTPGTYVLAVTSLTTSCVTTDEVVVTLDDAAPTVSAGPDRTLTCATTAVVLDGSGSGAGTLTFAWEPQLGLSDPASPTPSATLPGTYTLTVTDGSNGCRATDEVVVVSDVAPPVADAGPDVVLDCRAGGVALAGAGSGGNGSAGYAFAWDPPAAVSNPTAAATTALAAGTFRLTVTDLATGCTASDQVVVTSTGAPVVDAGPDTGLRCSDGRADLRGTVDGSGDPGGRQVQWTPSAGVADPSSLTTTTTQAGTYTLVVLDLATGCRSTDSVVVAAVAAPPVTSAGPDVFYSCVSDVAVLRGSASGGDGSLGYRFAWSPAAQVSDASIAEPEALAEGTYTLTVTDIATGCTATDQAVVTTDRRPPVAEAGADVQITCADATPVVTGSASGGNGSLGYAYSWSPAASVTDASSPTPEALQPGMLVLTVTDLANGCTATDTVEVRRDPSLPVASAGSDTALGCTVSTATLRGSVSGGDGSRGFTFRWEPAGLVGNPAAPVTTTTTPGTYLLTVTDVATGCASVDTVEVTQDVPPVPVEPSALDLRPAAEPLRIEDYQRTTGRATATWEALPPGLVSHLYQGAIASLRGAGYDHAPLACGLAASTHQFRPGAGGTYYLVTSANCLGAESSYGRSSQGIERPDAASASGTSCP